MGSWEAFGGVGLKERIEVKKRKTGKSAKKGGRERGEPETAVNDSEAALGFLTSRNYSTNTHVHAR